MELVVRCSDAQKNELAAGALPGLQVHYVTEVAAFARYPQAAACLDLLFENDPSGAPLLRQLRQPVILHSVSQTGAEAGGRWVRVNAWPGFLLHPVVEGSCPDPGVRQAAEAVWQQWGKTVAWLPDEPGFVTARVISSIINEAYFALGEGVGTRAAIDTAMKLGTNYPFGPFEWAERIGRDNIVRLLQKLAIKDERYLPAPLLLEEMGIG
ncbi:3-hydroxyacyl-CoA dehydrogenase family protein [Paraflavisolibacter sp. H34]|uniref:3-hydroxyacyl-CoA dehydrogenase family protein n=1 Tax=Huijunlia imazamoxiresistens TaxID=3127457 RepID=UPI00301A7A70